MKVTSISSESNPLLKQIRSLHRRQTREKEQRFLLEGSHCLIEAIKKSLQLESIVVSKTYLSQAMEELSQLDIDQIAAVDDELFDSLVSTKTSCGVLALARMPVQSAAAVKNWQPRLIVVADAIQDPGNLGTLVRTAYAANAGGMLVLKGSVDLYNPKLVRSAAGALFALPIVSGIDEETGIELLKEAGFKLVVCQAEASKAYFDLDMILPTALVLGNEGRGISRRLAAEADESISIPMHPGAESLNVAISGGIILFEAAKQRLMAARNK